MLLKSLEIENFRQFRGRQTVNFSTDKDKNVTIIMGENGSGKSYILGKINGENEKKYKKINESNEIKISKIGSPSLLKISQGVIIEQVKSGNLLENNSEYYD